MIKVMWLLKRAPHLTHEEFSRWWLERHCFDVARAQAPHLLKYVVNVRAPGDALAGEAEEPEWDGVAEQWFEDERAYNAAYSGPSPTRPDTLAHTSRLMRLVVTEHFVPTDTGRQGT
jgi:hypothetical protein